MNIAPFEGVPGQQLERLAHIEFLVYFTGKVTRKDIMSRFGVSSAAATRDLSTYIDSAPDNIVYDPRQKHYVATNKFQCLLPLSAEKCLSTLTSGFGDVMDGLEDFRCAYHIVLEEPELDITATFSRAISLARPVEVEYVSTSSGFSTRVICPHSLMNNGLRWHVRAYDRKREKFSDFVLNRVVSTKLLYKDVFKKNEVLDKDVDWVEEVELVIQPHPRLPKNSQWAVEKEFGMEGGLLIKKVRKAQAGYLLNSWNVDSTIGAELKGRHVFLHLKNAKALEKMKIDSLFLAPSLD
ncbi:WYL domain-containing protein [Halomonas sp. Mc5H-6]|uniref:helix-turn-helix transcriptional regulator n=1 Tax=Halomonas sp. Mc5H-6 TaxID=2954500 RepID=UPI00209690C5|nr:WYL domain-containing protein [Halomonas sp. Mc5H-6]MCO7248178.1 WYL domain-containing protein [Halomonas sp. Mc5H-6]